MRLPARRLPSAWSPALATAALLLAASSRGEVIVLGVALVASRPRPTALLAVAGALAATAWRWGSTSLEALAGAQAVLGPAGGVGPTAAAASSWLAAAAVVLGLARRRDPWSAAAAGAVVAALLAGPAPGGDVPVRAFVALGAAAAAYGLGLLRAPRRRLDGALAWLGAAAGAAAVVAAAPDAPPWPPTTELALVAEGAALAVSVAVLVVVADAAGRARWRRRGVPPIVMRPGAGVPARGTTHR